MFFNMLAEDSRFCVWWIYWFHFRRYLAAVLLGTVVVAGLSTPQSSYSALAGGNYYVLLCIGAWAAFSAIGLIAKVKIIRIFSLGLFWTGFIFGVLGWVVTGGDTVAALAIYSATMGLLVSGPAMALNNLSIAI